MMIEKSQRITTPQLRNSATPRRTQKRATITLVALISLFIVMSSAAADESIEYQIDYHLNHNVKVGEEAPTLRFEAPLALSDAEVIFERSDGHRQSEAVGDLRRGQSREVSIEQPAGTFNYSTTIRGTTDDGEELDFEFDIRVVVSEGLVVDLIQEEIDLEGGQLPIDVNQPVDRVQLEVFDENQRPVVDETTSFDGEEGRLDLEWEPQGSVSGVRVTVHDVDGNWHSWVLEPFWIEIPSQVINFDTGSAEIDESQEPKLRETRDLIQDAMAKIGDRESEMRLFVAGYTDTVGSADQNRSLSSRRAQSIAAWFAEHEIEMPIYYQGFGEDVLAIETDDEVEEEQNRRAVYILGNAPPPTSDQLPRSNWRRLR